MLGLSRGKDFRISTAQFRFRLTQQEFNTVWCRYGNLAAYIIPIYKLLMFHFRPNIYSEQCLMAAKKRIILGMIKINIRCKNAATKSQSHGY